MTPKIKILSFCSVLAALPSAGCASSPNVNHAQPPAAIEARRAIATPRRPTAAELTGEYAMVSGHDVPAGPVRSQVECYQSPARISVGQRDGRVRLARIFESWITGPKLRRLQSRSPKARPDPCSSSKAPIRSSGPTSGPNGCAMSSASIPVLRGSSAGGTASRSRWRPSSCSPRKRPADPFPRSPFAGTPGHRATASTRRLNAGRLERLLHAGLFTSAMNFRADFDDTGSPSPTRARAIELTLTVGPGGHHPARSATKHREPVTSNR